MTMKFKQHFTYSLRGCWNGYFV